MSQQPATLRPVLYWDGDCGFCRRWVERWQESSGESVQYRTLQVAPPHVVAAAGGDPPQRIVLETPDGRLTSGAQAALQALQGRSIGAKLLTLFYDRVPAFRTLAESAYRWVAGHRELCGSLTQWLWGASTLKPTYELSGWLFPRLIGAIFVSAFLSLWLQIDGLTGSRGILSVASHLQAAGNAGATFWQMPSLLWLGASDQMLHFWLAAGTVSSLMLLLGILPALSALFSWLCYLSFASAIPLFLNFQWDALLLEAGLLVALCTPWRFRSRLGISSPPRLGRLLVWWLLFRLMCESGVVKLFGFDANGYNAWLAGNALDFHYFTQPIPVATSWWFANLPGWFHRLSLILVFVIELLFPFFIWGPRRMRMTAFWGFSLLMILIMATGHYGFFNLLTLALAIALIDDKSWPQHMQAWLKKRPQPKSAPTLAEKIHRRVLPIFAALIFFLTSIQLLSVLRLISPAATYRFTETFAPWRSTNAYGLFSVMTTERPEITIEYSNDGRRWHPYRFRWKMSADRNNLPFLLPHMPRLDWQMWFAALEFRATGQLPGWLIPLLARLEDKSPPVLNLLDPGNTALPEPLYFRVRMELLQFTSPEERQATGNVWKSETLPTYTVEGRLQR